MCWFVTIGVPQASRYILEQLAREQTAVAFWMQDSTPTSALFGPDYACAQVSRGGCSCSLVFLPPEDPATLLERQRERLRKKGWTAARIERAVHDKSEALARTRAAPADTGLLSELVSSLAGATPGVRLYRHYYAGNQNAEVVPTPAEATISLRELEATGFPADTLVAVRAQA